MDKTIIRISQKAYALSIIGKGVQQLLTGSIDAIFLPQEFSDSQLYQWLIYPWGIVFTISGLALLFNKKAYEISVISGGIFLALFCFAHVPYFTIFSPERKTFLDWAPAIQELSFVGSSWIFAASCVAASRHSTIVRWLERFVPYGRIFFSIMLVDYGLDHFFYTELVATLVPAWIPYPIFWTYFAGIALIALGVAIILKFKLKLAGILVATMIFLWMVSIHIPNVIANHFKINDLEMSRVIVIFGFTGIALLIAFNKKTKN
jgi:uncharacterized membrane protein